MKYKFEKDDWAIVQIGQNENIISLICFKGIDNEFYWGQNRSWSVFGDNDKIIEYLGQVPKSKWDQMEIDYYKKYHPKKIGEIKQSAGWISPSGEWYTCSSNGHDGLAKVLAILYYDELDGGVWRLEQEGWFRVYSDGIMVGGDYISSPKETMTSEQRNIIGQLANVGNDKWKYKMNNYLGLQEFNVDKEVDDLENEQ